MPMVYIGADHAGFKAKELLKEFFSQKEIKVEDCGALVLDQEDDYPDIAHEVAVKIQKDSESLGILLCGSGGGVAVAANKHNGIRAIQAWDKESAQLARKDDNANIVAIGARLIDKETIEEIADTFVSTAFSNEDRYKRRLEKVHNLENL